MTELTDIDSVRQFMQKTTNDKTQDDDLTVLIIQASETIERYCSREFGPTANATRSFEWTPEGFYDVLDLAPYELRTLTAATVDPDLEGGVALTAVQYRLSPYPPRDGTFFGLRLSGLPTPKTANTTTSGVGTPLAFFTRRLDITGNWGMQTVPTEVQHYANLTVESWVHLRRDGGVAQAEAFGGSPTPRADDLPPAARWGLRRWMRPEALI